MVTPCNDEQQRQAVVQPCNRGRSELTPWVRLIEGEISSKHGAFQQPMSGQLRFPGSCPCPHPQEADASQPPCAMDLMPRAKPDTLGRFR